MKNKIEDLNNALFLELETLQDEDSYRNEAGEVDAAKARAAFERAEKVSEVAGRIMELQRLQFDALKFADSHGYRMKSLDTLMLEDRIERR